MVYRIDEFLRDYDFSAAYEIRIDAPALVVYQCLLGSDFSRLWLVRFSGAENGCRAIACRCSAPQR